MVISATRLKKVFRTEEVETTAISDVDLVVGDGEFVALMGPSGCGKSTLMNVLGLIDTLDGGTYKFLGQDVRSASEQARSRLRKVNIGFIFQSFNLIDDLTVYENVELPLIYNRVAGSTRRERVAEVLQRLEMQHRANHFPVQLSGGQQQRVAVARAIVNSPRLILADEPTGNLDSSHGDEVMRILQGLNKSGSTIVMVTHSEHDALFADRVVRLKDGRVVEDGREAMNVA